MYCNNYNTDRILQGDKNNAVNIFQSNHRQMNSVCQCSSLYKASEVVDFSKLLLIVLQKLLVLVIEIDYLIIYMLFFVNTINGSSLSK